MRLNKFDDGLMDFAGRRQFAELGADEIREPQFAIGEALHPFTKFGEVLFLYRLTDLERRQFQVGVNNPGVVAVVV